MTAPRVPLDTGRAKGKKRPIALKIASDPFADLALDSSDTEDGGDPFADLAAPQDNAVRMAPAVVTARKPFLGRLKDAAEGTIDAFKTDPVGTAGRMLFDMVKAPVESAERLLAPSTEGAAESDAAMRRIAEQRYGAVPTGWKVEGVTGKERAVAGAQTVANAIGAAVVGPGSSVLRQVGAGALAGATYNPDDPALGATLGGGIALPIAGATRLPGAVRRATDVGEGMVDTRGLLFQPDLTASPRAQMEARVGAVKRIGPVGRRPQGEKPLPPFTQPEPTPAYADGWNSETGPGSRRLEAMERGIKRRPKADVATKIATQADDPFADLAAKLDEPTAAPASAEPLPSYPEGMAMGDNTPRIPDVPADAPKGGRSGAGTFVLGSDAALKAVRGGLQGKTAKPGRLHAEARTEGGRLRDPQTVSDDGLLRELQSIRDRMSDAHGRAQYNAVFDENMQGVKPFIATRHGTGPSQQAKALQNLEDWERITAAIDAELQKRGYTDDVIWERTQSLADLDASLERDAIRAADELADVDDWTFGPDDVPAAKPPAAPPIPPRPTARDDFGPAGGTLAPEYLRPEVEDAWTQRRLDAMEPAVGEINWRTWEGKGGPILNRIEERAAYLRDEGHLDKGYLSMAEQRVLADRFAKELVANPLEIDPVKLRKLDGYQVVGLKQVVQEQTALLESASRAVASGTLEGDELQAALRVIDEAQRASDEALSVIVRESAQMGRNLGGLRQLAKQSLDPDVWLVQAKRMAGDKPLPDAVMVEIRRLAREAQEACG